MAKKKESTNQADEASAQTEETAPPLPAPNIIYRPKRVYQYELKKKVGKKEITIRRWSDKPTEKDSEGKETEPPVGFVTIGMTKIPVPDAEAQLAGFYLEPSVAARLVRSVKEYKFLKPLGSK